MKATATEFFWFCFVLLSLFFFGVTFRAHSKAVDKCFVFSHNQKPLRYSDLFTITPHAFYIIMSPPILPQAPAKKKSLCNLITKHREMNIYAS